MSQEAAASGSREAQARPEEAHEEEMCPICLDALADPTHVIPCRHTFFRNCIERWAADRDNCPLCRQIIGTLVRVPPPPPANAATRRPRRRLQRSHRRRERSPHRSRSVSPRRAQHSPPRHLRRLIRSLFWSIWDAEDEDDRLTEAQERQWGSGDHAQHPARPPAQHPAMPRRSLFWQWELNGRSRDTEDDEWLREVQEQQWGSGDHAQHPAAPGC